MNIIVIIKTMAYSAERSVRMQQYLDYSRRYSGGPEYIELRNKNFTQRERACQAIDDYIFSMGCSNFIIQHPHIYTVTQVNKAKLQLEKYRQDMHKYSTEYQAQHKKLAKHITHIRSRL
jgi:hypothetical protein